MRLVIKKAVTTEKSFKGQDKGFWTFVVATDATKGEIKREVENLFAVEVADVNTFKRLGKTRRLKGSRVHTKRAPSKIARVSLKEKSKKIDLTKLNK